MMFPLIYERQEDYVFFGLTGKVYIYGLCIASRYGIKLIRMRRD